MINSVTFKIFSSSLLPGFRFIVTEHIVWTIVMVQKSDTSASCDESGMGKLAVKLRG
jgi:hypothetical protein